jgi:putative glycosyltransferase (TIGR04348 family)
MNIIIITPAPPGTRKGNRVTALRWGRLLRQLGHRVAIRHDYSGQCCDLLIVLHARRSFSALEQARSVAPDRPRIVALTGTDLYDELNRDPKVQQSLALAWRIVVLQPLAVQGLPRRFRSKTRVIHQSSPRPRVRTAADRRVFQVCVLGHLRPVKDPFRTALAARLLPAVSRIRVVHLGAALDAVMAEQARMETAVNPRYRWLGDLPRWRALRILARSRLLVLTSVLEGGANVLSEAIAAGVPVLSSCIPGSMGILGARYPGYFPVGDTEALAKLLARAENDRAFYRRLRDWCRKLRPLVDPARERRAWRRLLAELKGRQGAAIPGSDRAN